MTHKLTIRLTNNVKVNDYTTDTRANIEETITIDLATVDLEETREHLDGNLDRFFADLKEEQRKLVQAKKLADREAKKKAESSNEPGF